MLENPPTPQEKTDTEHLKLIAIFHYIVSGLAAFFAFLPFIHLGMGVFTILVLNRPTVKELSGSSSDWPA